MAERMEAREEERASCSGCARERCLSDIFENFITRAPPPPLFCRIRHIQRESAYCSICSKEILLCSEPLYTTDLISHRFPAKIVQQSPRPAASISRTSSLRLTRSCRDRSRCLFLSLYILPHGFLADHTSRFVVTSLPSRGGPSFPQSMLPSRTMLYDPVSYMILLVSSASSPRPGSHS